MLSLEEVRKTFRPGRGLGRELTAWLDSWRGRREKRPGGVQAVRGVSLEIRPGEILGLVGESGSGKSTLGRIMAGLYRPEAGRTFFDGQDLASLDQGGWKKFRRRVQIMFQDPVSSLNPRLTAGAVVEEGLLIHGLGRAEERRARVRGLLGEVGLPADSAARYGHEFSGGQRQRLSLARALALDPELLIADEPVSALDVSIQAQIINLLMDLRQKRGLTLVLVSHDLPLVRIMADRLAVMYGGLIMELVERGLLDKVDHHPYVRSLWASAGGRAGPSGPLLEGEPPDPQNPPPGCPFHPRCREAAELCRREPPALTELAPGFSCACHRRPAAL
ncbi:MAG: ABC transporter ATP-binding protein [Candidatus Adiutrix sp.]|jgi:oligopeptide/dipeptide ABC transporter ATP-binding protein|nr:ABC transporter ATP-binding protein [Candidatus Adiutrix sp.]